VIDRLRRALNRPLNDGERPRLFAAAVAVILAAGTAFALLDDAGPSAEHSRAATSSSAPSPPAAAGVPVLPAQTGASLEAPSEEGQPSAELVASRTDVTQAKRTARRLLSSYLPYTYGRASAQQIRAASDQLRRRLRRDRPRVLARERRRRPRVELLQTEGVSRRHAQLAALVSDGARRYTVPLELERTSAGWTVTDVGS
jgi:hypothetical protein